MPIRVIAYTNCESVELFLNDESLGRKSVDPINMVEWQVPYRSGTLKAVAFRKGTSCQCIFETTGGPVAIGLEIHPSFDESQIPADGEFALPITAFAIDDSGRGVPTADNFVTFAISGPAKIIGVGNGDPTCHEPDKASSRSLFNGLAQVIVQTTATAGEILLVASAQGLTNAELRFASTRAIPRPSLPPAQVRHFISDWRMSPINRDRPDLRQQIPEHDMNTWERIDPARGAQPAWQGASGYAIYRAAFAAPKFLRATGGRIVFHSVAGAAEFYVNDAPAGAKQSPPSEPVEIPFPSASEKIVLAVLVTGNGQLSGIVGPVELLPVCTT
jgi:beta-galactosidase